MLHILHSEQHNTRRQCLCGTVVGHRHGIQFTQSQFRLFTMRMHSEIFEYHYCSVTVIVMSVEQYSDITLQNWTGDHVDKFS